MKLSQKQQKFTQDIALLILYIYRNNYSCTFGEAFRTLQQAMWYEQAGKGIKESLHCKRLAVDLNLFSPDGDYLSDTESHRVFGEFWESLDPKNKWGGRFSDGNHYQRDE